MEDKLRILEHRAADLRQRFATIPTMLDSVLESMDPNFYVGLLEEVLAIKKDKTTDPDDVAQLEARLQVIQKVFAQRRADEASLLLRLRNAAIRIRSGEETKVLVRGKQIRVRKERWEEQTEAFCEMFEREAQRITGLVRHMEIVLGIPYDEKKWAMVGGRMKRKEADPVVARAQQRILKFLQKNPGKWRKQKIMEELDMKSYLFGRAIKILGGTGKVQKEGSRRAMTYEAVEE